MTLADMIIVFIVGVMIVVFIYLNVRKKGQNVCAKCSYAKACTDECTPRHHKKKEMT